MVDILVFIALVRVKKRIYQLETTSIHLMYHLRNLKENQNILRLLLNSVSDMRDITGKYIYLLFFEELNFELGLGLAYDVEVFLVFMLEWGFAELAGHRSIGCLFYYLL